MAVRNGRRRIFSRIRRRLNGLSIDGIVRTFAGILNRPISLGLIVLAIIVTISVSVSANDSKTDNILETLHNKTSENTAISPTTKWLKDNNEKTIGILWLVAAVFGGAIPSKQIVFSLIVVLFTVYMPKAGITEYVLQAAFLLLILKIKRHSSRVIIIIVAFLMYMAEYLFKHIKTK